MSELDPLEVPALLLRMVPETAEHIAELYEMPADKAVTSEAARYDTFALLQEAFMEPVVLPELTRTSPDAELMGRCFEFADLLVRSSTHALTGPVYFQVLEEFFDTDLLEKAIPFMREATRKRTARMLTGHELPVPEALLR
ncbi:hypothetical protein ACIBK8_09915 [Streptomyces sp. NPDC050161]|uniref:hypothetical protein n=1 Tax=Streptomyces sp. NPDC050161 TaxID=3365604 RepID=UPI003797059C